MALSFHTSSPFDAGSSLPQDSLVFERDRNAGMLRYHARRVVGGRTHRGHRRAIGIASGPTRQLASALHLLPFGTVAVDAVGIKLYAHRTRVEFTEIDLHFKLVPVSVGLDFHFTEAQRWPRLLYGVVPLDHLPAHRAFIGGTLAVGCGARKVVLLRVFANRAVRGEARRQSRHAVSHPRHPSRGDTLPVAGIKLGNHFPFQQVVERFGFG